MLYCYPVAATAENWLHDCLVKIIRSAFRAMDVGNEPVAWPDCIPASHRDQLRARRGLRDRVVVFCSTASKLSGSDRCLILGALIAQNNQPAIFDGVSYCPAMADLPEPIRDPARELFGFGFELLAELGLRDLQYRTIHAQMPSRICPFCGYEYFDAPGAPRHALDHYLPISRYPFPGANLRNLVPMGDRCNSAFKGQADTLTSSAGQRRRCFDPYGGIFGSVSLKGSRPFEGDGGMLPEWEIDLGQSPEAATWDEIWQIKTRYKRDVLNQEYLHWLGHFAQWCRSMSFIPVTKTEIIDLINNNIDAVIQEGIADRAFLRRAVFEMLKEKATTGPYSDRLTEFFIDLASPERGAAA